MTGTLSRRSTACAAAVLAGLLAAPPAHAAAPPGDLDRLTGGGAILRVAAGTTPQTLAGRLGALAPSATSYARLPFVAVRGDAAALRAAASRDEVVAAHPDARLELELNDAGPLVFGGAAQRDALYAEGLDGSGQTVAVVDSGVDGTHPDLRERVVRNVKFEGVEGGPVTSLTCPDGTDCNFDGTGGHGTAVAGVAVGDGTASNGFYRGMAPGASLVGLSVGDGVTISFALAAYDYLLAHPGLGVVAVNNSFGKPQSEGVERYDPRDPVNVATRALDAAGISVVFSAGNSGTGSTPREGDPPGASDCSTEPDPENPGERRATTGVCRSNVYSVAPWALGAANGRKDGEHLTISSARGDPREQVALDGSTIRYEPALTAPGTNVRTARGPGPFGGGCGISAEPPACTPPPGAEAFEPFYVPTSGTSFAAPHVTGAVAVVQDAAAARLGRRLTTAEVRAVLLGGVRPMPEKDLFYDWPCEDLDVCGSQAAGTTGEPYARWQAGAGYLHLPGALARLEALRPARAEDAGGGQPPAPPPPREAAPPLPSPVPVAAGCRDGIAPRSRVTSARRDGRRLTLRGRSTDRGCPGAVRVRVAVALRTGRLCRPVGPRGRLGTPRSCLRPRYLDARGARSWRLRLPLPRRGRYLVWVRGIDAAGNVERKDRTRNLRRLTLR